MPSGESDPDHNSCSDDIIGDQVDVTISDLSSRTDNVDAAVPLVFDDTSASRQSTMTLNDVEEGGGSTIPENQDQNESERIDDDSSFRRYQVSLASQEESSAAASVTQAQPSQSIPGQEEQQLQGQQQHHHSQQQRRSLVDMLDESDYFNTADNEMMVILAGAVVEDHMLHDVDDDLVVASTESVTTATVLEQPCSPSNVSRSINDSSYFRQSHSTTDTSRPSFHSTTSQDGITRGRTSAPRISFREVSMAFSLANGPDAILVEASRDTFCSKLLDKRIQSILLLLFLIGVGLLLGILFAVDVFSLATTNETPTNVAASAPSAAPSQTLAALPTVPTINPHYKLPDKIHLTYHDTCGTIGQWRQINYRGNISQTTSGIECQMWSKQVPQTHRFVPMFFQDEYDIGEHNYCRNPDPYDIYDPYRKAFCIPNISSTNSSASGTSFEYCNVPACGFCGTRDFTTTSSSSSPYGYDTSCSRTCSNDMDCAGQQDNVDGDGETCLFDTDCHLWTTSPRHHHHHHNNQEGEYESADANHDDHRTSSSGNDSPTNKGNVQELDDESYRIYTTPISMNCGSKGIGQANYRGAINVTSKGHTCQSWNTQSPHLHIEHSNHNPYNGLDGNYCRCVVVF